MHRFTAIILSLIIAVSVTACGNSAANPPANRASAQSASSSETGSASESNLTLTGEIAGEITVSAYDTMQYRAFLEDAARLFMVKYPGTTVNVETFSAMPEMKTSEQGNKRMQAVQVQDDPQGRADYISKTNTALMSGGGADLLAMDVLPLHKYADSGQLENLADYMDADSDFNKSDYHENILNAIQYKNGTWFLPMDYTFDYYAYDSTLLTDASPFGTGSAFTVEELIGLASTAFDGTCKLLDLPDYNKFSGGVWGSLLEERYTSFVDLENKTANFNDGAFAALLETVKQYADQGYIAKGVTGQSDAGMMLRGPNDTPTDRFFFKPKNVFNLISQFTRSSGMRINIMTAGGAPAIEDDDAIAGIASNANGAVPFTYTQAYGINADSQNKETAWAFLKFLLSEEMQLNTNLMPTSLPMLNSAREKKAKSILTGAMMGRQEQELSAEQQEALVNYNAAVEQLSGQINTYVLEDSVIGDMIAAEAAYFFEGGKTADEVADTLQSKVSLYLNE